MAPCLKSCGQSETRLRRLPWGTRPTSGGPRRQWPWAPPAQSELVLRRREARSFEGGIPSSCRTSKRLSSLPSRMRWQSRARSTRGLSDNSLTSSSATFLKILDSFPSWPNWGLVWTKPQWQVQKYPSPISFLPFRLAFSSQPPSSQGPCYVSGNVGIALEAKSIWNSPTRWTKMNNLACRLMG